MPEIKEKQRTLQQNKALWLWFELVASALNDAGLDIKKILAKNPVEIPWSKNSVCELLWRPLQEIQLNKHSTTQLLTTDIDIIFETINRFLAGFGIHSDFPSIDSLIDSERNDTREDYYFRL